MERLWAPWRMEYFERPKNEGCIFCQTGSDREQLVLWRTPLVRVMLNRYPYANGHLMVAPYAHVATPDEASAEARREFWPLVLAARRVLARAYEPDGFNLGTNLGRVAGAGVPGHFHFHLVPRWEGDTNFMSVVGQVRLVPEDLAATAARLRPLFAAEAAT
jgi:ATP adenylyltransferase